MRSSSPDSSLVSAVMSRLHEAAVVTSEEGRVTEANDAFCRLAGFGRDELIGRMVPLLDGIPCASSADAPDVAAVPSWIASVVVVCADGSPLNVLASLARIAIGDGAHAYLVCVQLDPVPMGRLLGNRKPSL
jgi:PAS domain-containing protein